MIYQPPSDFSERLAHVFGGRLRIRWSPFTSTWHLEQHMGRASMAAMRKVPRNDKEICARDGYDLVMEILPRCRFQCRFCYSPLNVTPLEIGEVCCGHCMRRNRDARWAIAWFPLGEILIDHLQRIDPLRADILERIRREEAEAHQVKERTYAAQDREAAAQFKDHLIDQLPKAGFPSLVPDGWRH